MKTAEDESCSDKKSPVICGETKKTVKTRTKGKNKNENENR